MHNPRRNYFHLYLVCLCAVLFCTWGAAGQTPRKTALFVENRAGVSLNDKVVVFEDFLASRITELGFSVISREIAQQALKTYASSEIAMASAALSGSKASTGEGHQSSAAIEVKAAAVQGVAAAPTPTKTDQTLSDGTSALRLAQNLGADYLLVASISSFGTEKRVFTDGDLKTANSVFNLRVAYRVMECVEGASFIGDTIRVSKTVRQTANSHTESEAIAAELLDEAARQVAENAGGKLTRIAPAPSRPNLVEISVTCRMQDLGNMPVSVPDIRLLEDGGFQVFSNRLGVQVLNATVEVDGLAVGSAPGRFKVRPGLGKLRVSHEGFQIWERAVNFTEGQQFNVPLQMSEAGYARWKDNAEFLSAMNTAREMTDGIRESLNGFAQMLRQSGYQVDIKKDLKANGKSLYDGATIEFYDRKHRK